MKVLDAIKARHAGIDDDERANVRDVHTLITLLEEACRLFQGDPGCDADYEERGYWDWCVGRFLDRINNVETVALAARPYDCPGSRVTCFEYDCKCGRL